MERTSNYNTYLSLYEKIVNIREESQLKEATNRINYYSNIIEEYIDAISYVKEQENESYEFKNLEKGLHSTFLYNDTKARLIEYDKLKTDLEKPFKLFIVGSGSYGKSTLINSLLGGDYAESDSLPKTWKVDFYEKRADSELVELHYKTDTKIQKVSKKKAREIIENEEKKVAESEKLIRKKLKAIKKENKNISFDEAQEYKIKIENEYKYLPEINEVHWGVTDAEILDNLILVDTPGLDQKNYSGNVIDDVESFSDQSDGIIWMLNATTIDSRITTTAFSSINAENVIAVINKIDAVESKEAVVERASELYSDVFKSIIPYSALDVYDAHKAGDEKLKNEAGYKKLMSVIQKSYLRNASSIQADRVNQSCINYNLQTFDDVVNYNDKITTDYSKVIRGIAEINDVLEAGYQKLRQEFRDLLQNEINKTLLNLSDHLEVISKIEEEDKKKEESKKQYYLLEKVFQQGKIISIRKDYIRQTNLFGNQQYNLVLRDYLVTQYKHLNTYKNLSNAPQAELNTNIKSTDIFMPSIFNSTAIGGGLGLFFGPLGGAIGAGVGGLFSSYMRNDTIEKVENSIRENYEEIATDYEKFMDDYFDEIYEEIRYLLAHSHANIYNLTPYIEDDIAHLENLVNHITDWNNHLLYQLEDKNVRFTDTLEEIILKY